MTPAIRTEALTKHYGDVKALVDLDLEIHSGEVFGFLGPRSGRSSI
jgi:ABC-2 type transport system ATP-binding protein